jgi:hypothetical protein
MPARLTGDGPRGREGQNGLVQLSPYLSKVRSVNRGLVVEVDRRALRAPGGA